MISTMEECRMKKWMALCLAFALCLTVTACSSDENAVFVQKVGDLAVMGGIAPGDKFPGIVVSENTTENKKELSANYNS